MAIGVQRSVNANVHRAFLILVAAPLWFCTPSIAGQNADIAGSVIIEKVINPKTKDASFGLGDRIEIALSGPGPAIQRAASDPKGIVLVFDDTALHGLCTNAIVFGSPQLITNYVSDTGRAVETNVASSATQTNAVVTTNLAMKLQFKLHRTEANKIEWLGFLGSPRTLTREIEVSLGMNSDHSIITLSSNRFPATLIVLPHAPFFEKGTKKWNFSIFCAIAGGIIGLGFIVCAKCKFVEIASCWAHAGSWAGWIILLIALYCCAGPMVCWVTLLVLFVGYFFSLAWWSEMLRDSGPEPPPGLFRPYSLARTQMAIWFFLIVLSFVFIWLMTSALDSLTGTVLALMGIGAGTALGAEAQFTNKQEKQIAEAEKKTQPAEKDDNKPNDSALVKSYSLDATRLHEEKEILELRLMAEQMKTLEEKEKKGPLDDDERVLLETIRTKFQDEQTVGLLQREREFKFPSDIPARIKQLERLLGCRPVSEGFFDDVLSDDVGISFHRFQMFVWTIVLAVIFLSSVYSQLAMPEFNGTLLALLGISSGTYLGFMIIEPPAKVRSKTDQ